jgi:hypothetical protein
MKLEKIPHQCTVSPCLHKYRNGETYVCEVAANLSHCFGVFKNFASRSIKALKIDTLIKVKNIHMNMLTARKSLG